MTKLPRVPGTPDVEHSRSPVALRTAQLAAESQLWVAHFEHRALLPWPRELCPPGLEALSEPAAWSRGKLAEHSYASFRHDRMTGSFHPGHRAKWTAHELVHLLVGFAYQPGASRYFHALAAWLSELLPVAVYYFFDEAGLRRCPAHAGGGPLYGSYCPACEREALRGARAPSAADEAFLREGRAFVDAELAAFSRARRTGLPHGHRHATLDLCSDGMGYAAAHALRLDSELFERFAATFFAPGQGLHADLDALEGRVIEVLRSLLDGQPLRPWQADATTWKAQDLAYRMLLVLSETEGEAAEELGLLVDALADTEQPDRLTQVAASYIELAAEWELPPASELFALGYPIDELGSDIDQLSSGVASACPNTYGHLAYPEDWLTQFAADDLAAPERAPIGRRFARWLTEQEGGPLADLARYEAALTHAAPADPCADALDAADLDASADVKLPEGVELLRLDWDVLDRDDLTEAKQLTPPLWLAVRTTSSGELVVAELGAQVAEHLHAHPTTTCEALGDAFEELAALRLVVPTRYAPT